MQIVPVIILLINAFILLIGKADAWNRQTFLMTPKTICLIYLLCLKLIILSSNKNEG